MEVGPVEIPLEPPAVLLQMASLRLDVIPGQEGTPVSTNIKNPFRTSSLDRFTAAPRIETPQASITVRGAT